MPEENSKILVLNGGSSSLKLAIFDRLVQKSKSDPLLWSKNLSFNLLEADDAKVHAVLSDCLKESGIDNDAISCVGHRVVHGGAKFVEARLIDDAVEAEIEKLRELAPVHNPIAAKLIRQARKFLPDSMQLAVFDTAFHSSLSCEAFMYPLPYKWYQNYGIRKFGFHGINHQYCSSVAEKLLNMETSELKIVSCHLGNGCSLAAVKGGVSVDTSMGFTPLDGLMMGARCGSIDPGIIFYMLQEKHMTVSDLEYELNNHAGLLGVSEQSKDMRQIEELAAAGDKKAILAFLMFVRRIISGIAGMAASMNGINAIVFTAGIGENSLAVRKAVCDGLGFLGLRLDDSLNNSSKFDGIISTADSLVKVLRIEAREDLQIYRECLIPRW